MTPPTRRARNAAIRKELRAAIEHGEITTDYQPIVDMRDGRPVRIEALARWTHPGLGPVPPGEFIPIAEHAGLIGPLTWLLLERALRDLRPWRRLLPTLRVAVNVSAQSLAMPHLAEEIVRSVDRADASPDQLALEITESVLMADPDRSRYHVERLRRLGARVELDDFGTGYSSLRYLQLLRIDSVKIDREFVGGLFREPGNETIVRAIVRLCHELGVEAVAEGVEDREAWDALRSLGCESAQGNYIARPMPAADVTAWIARSRTGRAATDGARTTGPAGGLASATVAAAH